MDKVKKMKELTDQVAETYAAKNEDYGDSFGVSFSKYGIVSALTRMSDKWNRLESLALSEKINNEPLEDTLMDLAAYALMTLMEIEKETGE